MLFFVHQVMQKGLGIHFAFFDDYLDPFCFSALTLPLFVLERKLFFNQPSISISEVVMLVLFLIVYSELILPYFFSQFVFDVWDIFAIVLGGVWFYSLRLKSIRYS